MCALCTISFKRSQKQEGIGSHNECGETINGGVVPHLWIADAQVLLLIPVIHFNFPPIHIASLDEQDRWRQNKAWHPFCNGPEEDIVPARP